jgi:repressor LexA
MREIARHFTIGVGAVQTHVEALKKKGHLTSVEKRPRSFSVLPKEDSAERKIPIRGTVAAGTPLLQEDHHEGFVGVASSWLKPGATYFALRVRGESMQGVGILDGDLAVIEQKVVADDGQIVVAVVNDAITLKRYFREPDRVRLQAENPVFHDIFTQDIRIAGVLAQIIREY